MFQKAPEVFCIFSYIPFSICKLMYLPVNTLVFAAREATLFFYENVFYKNIEAEICKIFKNMIRINSRLRFWKGYNFVCWKSVNEVQLYVSYLNRNIIPFSQRQKWPPKRKAKRASTTIYPGQIHSKTEKSKVIILE